LIYRVLPQLLTPGVLDPDDDNALLMLVIRLQDAVENFNDQARTYNMAWASDRHPQVVARLRQDLEWSYRDYSEAHEQLLYQIEEVRELGGPLNFELNLERRPWEELREWWRTEVRVWRRHESRLAWLRYSWGRVRRHIARGLPHSLPFRRRRAHDHAQAARRDKSPDTAPGG
jgi:hypothetical protein